MQISATKDTIADKIINYNKSHKQNQSNVAQYDHNGQHWININRSYNDHTFYSKDKTWSLRLINVKKLIQVSYFIKRKFLFDVSRGSWFGVGVRFNVVITSKIQK